MSAFCKKKIKKKWKEKKRKKVPINYNETEEREWQVTNLSLDAAINFTHKTVSTPWHI